MYIIINICRVNCFKIYNINNNSFFCINNNWFKNLIRKNSFNYNNNIND